MSLSAAPDVPIYGCPHGNVIQTCHSCWSCAHGNAHSTCVECHPERLAADPKAVSLVLPPEEKMQLAVASQAGQSFCPHGEPAALCLRCK